MDYIKRLLQEARKTLTAWLAMGVAGLAQIDSHIDDLYAMVPGLKQYLPPSKYTDVGVKWAICILGLVMVWSRVRRKLKEPAPT